MKIPAWIVPAAFALILWGVWGVFQKLAVNQMLPRNVYLVSAVGAISTVVILLSVTGPLGSMDFEGALFGVLAGICSSLGGFLFLQAMSKGEAALVIPFTALYPAVSILLSFVLLQETITLKQGIGILLALCAMVLMV